MSIEFSVDLISDLKLDKHDIFDWTGKSTSLFCVIAGNISAESSKIAEVLEHLSTVYRGVFYIDGRLEHTSIRNYENRVKELKKICDRNKNVIYLHEHAVVLNGIAFLAINGWYNSAIKDNVEDKLLIEEYKNQDVGYLSNSIRSLQLHREVSKIVIISSCIPSEHLLYQHHRKYNFLSPEPGLALVMDTDRKVTHWLYGGVDISTDMVYNRRRYVNNPNFEKAPYWPKKIVI